MSEEIDPAMPDKETDPAMPDFNAIKKIIDAMADEISGYYVGDGYYSHQIGHDDAHEIAKIAFMAMIEAQR